MRLAPFLFLLVAIGACGSPALTPGSASRAPAATAAATAAADIEEISLEISALM